jgi:effector-binding domain-containing protein
MMRGLTVFVLSAMLALGAHAQQVTPPANPPASPPVVAPAEAPPAPAAPPVAPPVVAPPALTPSVPTIPAPGSLVTPPAAPVVPPATPSAPTTSAPVPQTPDQATLPGIGGPEEVVIAPRPVLILKGQSTWDDGYDTLMESFQKLSAEAARLKLPITGRPQAVFTSTDDSGFRFEAMVTLATEPSAPLPGVGREFQLGKSPEGKALKFVHTGAYDDIDTTYEAITAYLDEKGMKARNLFVEEYTNDTKGSDDGTLVMNIFILIE